MFMKTNKGCKCSQKGINQVLAWAAWISLIMHWMQSGGGSSVVAI